MITAAGVLFLAPGDKALFLKRAPGSDYPGYWCFPGGKLEAGETLEQCAQREATEECGSVPSGSRAEWTRQIAPYGGAGLETLSGEPAAGEEVDYTCFLQRVAVEFVPVVEGEHTGYAWAPAAQPPEPMHPGCAVALDRLTMDELGVARAIAAGRLTSPQRYQNVTLQALRVTGTGVAYRHKDDEFVWRDPSIYLNDEFLARCNGLPVIYEHPKKDTLDSKEFENRVVGMIMLPYINGNEVWGVAKLYDDDAIKILSKGPMSTSPGVVLRVSENVKVKLESGENLLIEGKPCLLDHLAICERGVWDKGGEPTGVLLTKGARSMPDELRVADAATDSKLDKLLDGLGSIGKRLDSQDTLISSVVSRVDSMSAASLASRLDNAAPCFSARKDDDSDETYSKRHDAEEEEEVKRRVAAGEPKEVAADKAKTGRKDAEAEEAEAMKEKKAMADKKKADEDKEKEASEKAKTDSATQERIKALEARLAPMTDDERRQRADAQARADSVFQAFGDSAPRPLDGETLSAYRVRVASKLKGHSANWKGVELSALADTAAFDVAETQIYADAVRAADHPTDLPDDELRAIVKTDHFTGTRKIDFVGKHSFVRQLKSPTVSRVARFLTAGVDRR